MTSEQDISDLARRITEKFAPEQIILFGSHAYGNPREDSDVDLLIIMPFEGRGRAKSREIWGAIRPRVSVDLVVRKPEDVARSYAEWDPLIREALDKGKVLYEQNRTAVAGEIRR